MKRPVGISELKKEFLNRIGSGEMMTQHFFSSRQKVSIAVKLEPHQKAIIDQKCLKKCGSGSCICSTNLVMSSLLLGQFYIVVVVCIVLCIPTYNGPIHLHSLTA